MGIEAIVVIAASLASAAASARTAQIQRQEAKKAGTRAQTQARLAEIQNQRAQREIARKQRLASAAIANAAAISGTTGSTGELGGIASVASQAAGQQSLFSARAAGEQAQFGQASDQARVAGQIAGTTIFRDLASGVATTSGNIATAGGGYEKLFQTTPPGGTGNWTPVDYT